MAKLSSILFNRTVSQFLACDDLESKKGKALIEKIRLSAGDFQEKILATMAQAEEPHLGVLKAICLDNFDGITEAFLLDSLSHDKTEFRSSASKVLAQSSGINAIKLFKRLHTRGASPSETIEVLRAHAKHLKPEHIINNAALLDADYALELLNLTKESEEVIDLSGLNYQVEKITDATFKIALLRYFSEVNQTEIVALITPFLSDSNKLVILEALKSLDHLNFRFDASVILPYIATMNELEQKLGLEIIDKQSDAALIPKLVPYLSTKVELISDAFVKIIAERATRDSLETFLSGLERLDSWVREQVVNSLQSSKHKNLKQVAKLLGTHDKEFVRDSALKISELELNANDLERIGEFALNENWQVRERAIQSLGKYGKREAIGILSEVLKQWPDTASAILDATKRLGFSKGLEIAFKCLPSPETSIQRKALETIAVISSEKHAMNARDKITSFLPRLNPDLTELANKVIDELSDKFDLSSATAVIDPNEISDPSTIDSRKDSKKVKFGPGSIWMDRYHIKKEIGQGAMGQVVLAEDSMVEELLILKFMHPELTVDKASRERFKREVKYARRVGHPNVIRVHDLLLQDNLCAISMEYFKGRGLEKLLSEKDFFKSREGLKILYQVSDGMAAAHQQAVVHRDLKPSNILIDETGHVKIADFGIASASSGAEQTLTQTGSIIGSPAYLAPERAGEMEADNRCDIYSLGIIAYYMFSGKLPYVGQPMEVIIQHREGKAPRIDKVNASADSGIAKLVQKLMAVKPSDRLQTMVEVRDEIKQLLDSL
ncbi:MAG: serine/threonine protein kinase [Gammaproteobacteria bacterium]|nr:serine/threonine protein kinase [Gammaproteobacteria bacterium]